MADRQPHARPRFEAALGIAERLARANPSSAEAQHDVSVELDRLGPVLHEAGDLAGARARIEAAVAIDERLAWANLSNAEARRELSIGLRQLGQVLRESGALSGARARFEAALGIAEWLAEADPSSSAAQQNLRLALTNLAGVLAAVGDSVDARRCCQAMLNLAQRHPLSVDANTSEWVLPLLGRFGEAGAHFATLVSKTNREDPVYTIYLGNLANARMPSGEIEMALASYREGMKLRSDFQQLVRDDLGVFLRHGFHQASFAL